MRKIRQQYDAVRAELEAELAAMRRAGTDQTFSAFHARQVLLQVRDGLRAFQKNLANQLDDGGLAAATLAQRHTVNAIKQFERRFSGTTPVLRLEEASVFARVYAGVEPTLLHRYHRLTTNYPMATLDRVRNNLALSMIRGEGVQAAVNRIAGKDGIFDREKWRAERIVRTEGAYAYGAVGQRSLAEVSQQVPRLMKRLVATDDVREGEDSKQLDGQTVPWDQPFVWKKPVRGGGIEVVQYMHPPNRPHDREVVIPWRADYHAGTIHAGPVEPRMPRGLP